MSEIRRLVSLGIPVLCFDTCSILDIVRDLTRNSITAREHEAAVSIVSAMENGPMLAGLLAQQVQGEFVKNLQTVVYEATVALERLRRQMVRIDAVVGVLGRQVQTDLSHLEGHVDRSRQIVDRLTGVAVAVPQGDKVPERAVDRMIADRTPARKGKDAIKDCLVIETYLETARDLRANGLAAKIVFVSSNTRDYAGETGSTLRPDLAREFAVLGMVCAPNLAAAHYFLDL